MNDHNFNCKYDLLVYSVSLFIAQSTFCYCDKRSWMISSIFNAFTAVSYSTVVWLSHWTRPR